MSVGNLMFKYKSYPKNTKNEYISDTILPQFSVKNKESFQSP